MFDNYVEEHLQELQKIRSLEDTVRFFLNMLNFYHICLYYDPDRETSNSRDDDLLVYCKVKSESDLPPSVPTNIPEKISETKDCTLYV